MLLPIRTLVQLSAICGCVAASFLQSPFSSNRASQRQAISKDYSDHVVLRLATETLEDARHVNAACVSLDLDVWLRTDDHSDIHLPQDSTSKFFDLLPTHLRQSTTYLMPDLSHAIRRTIPMDRSRDFLSERVPSINDTFFADYQSVEAINAWMTLVVALHAPRASLVDLGMTHEGRSIQGLKLSRPRSIMEQIKGKQRKVILVHGAQHAREWISVSTVCYLAYSLAANEDDRAIDRLLKDFDWIFIPTLNVDGYAYSFQDRLWRKNRQSTTVPFCKGIDLDRNWAYGWADARAIQTLQSSPCSENYEGREAFEAIEARLLSEYIQSIHEDPNYKLVGYLDLHSYAQTILYPYALSCDIDVRDEESLIELGVGASKAMKASSGEHYDTASACNQDGHVLASVNSGAALDWVYHSGVPWSYVVKLRDTGSYGFLVPREEIVPTGEEMLGFLKYFGTFITEHS